MRDELMAAEEVAKRLGLEVFTVRQGLIQGLFPFGCAIRARNSYRYVIIRERFEKYMRGEDIAAEAAYSTGRTPEQKT